MTSGIINPPVSLRATAKVDKHCGANINYINKDQALCLIDHVDSRNLDFAGQ